MWWERRWLISRGDLSTRGVTHVLEGHAVIRLTSTGVPRTTPAQRSRQARTSACYVGVLLLLGVDEAKWPWLPHRAAPSNRMVHPSRERQCPRVAEGGTGRRPHARPEAALPTAKPAALTQYRNSSPIAHRS